MEPVQATVAIVTFNGDELLGEILEACQSQRAPFPFEILVVDSGSTDRTLDILAAHPGVWLHQIPNSAFGHGRTRNLASRLAAGDFVVFLTQDATPIGPTWLVDLLAPLEADPDLAGVFARQVPRPGCGPTTSREVVDTFRNPPAGFFSNVCSAMRRSALHQIPFRDVNYAEDRAWAADVRAGGWRTAYAPTAQVRHSHDLALGPYFRRMYDEAKGVAAVGPAPRTDLLWLGGASVRGTWKDWRLLATDPNQAVPAKLRWAAKVPLYNVARRLAIGLAGRSLPRTVSDTLSLDASRRRVVSSA